MPHIQTKGYLLAFSVLLLLLGGGCDEHVSQSQSEIDEDKLRLISIPRFANSSKGKAQQITTPPSFTCVVSTLLPGKAKNNYRYNTYKIQIPKSLRLKANGFLWKTFMYGSQKAPFHAKQIPGYGGIVRVARCRIPNSKLIINWLNKRFKKYSLNSWIQNMHENPVDASMTSGKIRSKWVCDEWWVTVV